MTNVPIKPTEKSSKKENIKKIILYGSAGTGKTTSLATILLNNPDLRLICLMTERNAMSGLEFGLDKYKITPKEGQILYAFPKETKNAFEDISRVFKKHATTSKKDSLKGNSDSTEGRENYEYLTKVIDKFVSFSGIDFVTNEEVKIGNVGKLTENDVLIIDGLSPIVSELWNSMVGDKIVLSQNDFGPVQRALYGILSNLAKLSCHVILLAHDKEEFEEKEIGNGKTISSLKEIRVLTNAGTANYNQIMGLFTDVIYCYKFGALFKWSGNKQKVYTVARNIPAQDNLEPNFSIHKVF